MTNNKIKTIIIRVAAVLFLVALGVLMYFLGRGHTVYIDNKKLDYEDTTYEAPYKVEVYVDGERVAKLYDKERGSSICIGANFSMELVVIEEKGGDEVTEAYSFKLPYDKDGLIINIPGVRAGLPVDAYMTEFISTTPEEVVEEDVVTDEFAMDAAEF